MKTTTYIHLPDMIRSQAQMLVDAGMFGNMSELIREAVRHYIDEKKLNNLQLALELYKKEKISLGKAAAIAGIPYDEMLDELYLHGIQPRVGPETKKDAEKELGTAKRLLK